MANWFDILAYKDHYKDYLQEAENFRRIQPEEEARITETGTIPNRIICWLGERLIDWGNRLVEQRQFARLESRPAAEKAGCKY